MGRPVDGGPVLASIVESVLFFFQAEDGIRDVAVTGVQTCALPICVPLTGLRPSAIAARGIVRTFQRTSVFPSLSVADNVMIGLHLRGSAGVLDVLLGWRRRAAEESRLVHDADGILEFVGLGHRRGEVASELPYGEQRLVELAGAPAAPPRPPFLHAARAGQATPREGAGSSPIRPIPDQATTARPVAP